jgi:hypothetical protein
MLSTSQNLKDMQHSMTNGIPSYQLAIMGKKKQRRETLF